MTEPTSEFDFDSAPAAGQTLTDQQPERTSGDFDDFDDECEDNSPKKPVKCNAVYTKPNKWAKDGNSGVAFNFTANDGEIVGFEAPLFLTLKGAASRVQRGKQDLAKLCKKLGIEPTGKTSELLDQITAKANDAEVEVTFKPGTNGGTFVNL